MNALSTFVHLIPVTLATSLLYAFIALAILLPFRLLSFPDLTSEGAFPLGGMVGAALIIAGLNPFLATVLAALAGAVAGATTALIHLRFRINTLLAGILVMTALYSVNLRVLGRANVTLFDQPSVFSLIDPAILTSDVAKTIVFGLLILAALLGLWWFLQTEMGVRLRAVGANATLAPALGISVAVWTLCGLAIANGFAALAGALLVQQQGFADVGMGFGVLISGLAAVVIGETILGRGSILRILAGPVVGAVVYYQVVSLGLALGLHPSDLKLATAAFVLCALALPALRGGAGDKREGLGA
ncbi:MAG: ABC transporter permease [Rhodospirillales bacterium]|jgi:putative ABC transport system permease protein